eukprot:jgi/Mesvir1/29304/Mv01565-RA.2
MPPTSNYNRLRRQWLALHSSVLLLLALPALGLDRISFLPARIVRDSPGNGFALGTCDADDTEVTPLVAGSRVRLSWPVEDPHESIFTVSLVRPLVVNGNDGVVGVNYEVHQITEDDPPADHLPTSSLDPTAHEATVRIPLTFPACAKCILHITSALEDAGDGRPPSGLRHCATVRILPPGDMTELSQDLILPAGRPAARILITSGPTSSTTCTPSTLPGLDCSISLLSGRYVLHWRASGDDLSFAVDVTTTGYVAFGFNSRYGKMVGGEAVIGWVGADGTGASIRAYSLTGERVADIIPNGNIALANTSIVQTSGRTLMRFRYPAETLAARRRHLLQDAVHVSMTSSNNIIFAYGASNVDRLEDHRSNKGYARVNFFDANWSPSSNGTGANNGTGGNPSPPDDDVTEMEDLTPYYKAHGALMVAGWGVLIPVGVAAARFGKRRDPAWFHFHRTCQTLGLICATVAFIFALTKFDVDFLETKHGKVGFTAMILMWTQPVFGNRLVRPHKGDRWRRGWEWLHIGSGRAGVVLAIVAIFFGFFRYELKFGTDKKARDCWIAWLSFAAAMYVVLEWFAQRPTAPKQVGVANEPHDVEMQT